MANKRPASSSSLADASKRPRVEIPEENRPHLVVEEPPIDANNENTEGDANTSIENWTDYPIEGWEKNPEQLANADRQPEPDDDDLLAVEACHFQTRPAYHEVLPALQFLHQQQITHINDPNLPIFADESLPKYVREMRKAFHLAQHLTPPPAEEDYMKICWSCQMAAPNQSEVQRCSRCPRVAHLYLGPFKSYTFGCQNSLFAQIVTADADLVPSYKKLKEEGHGLCWVCQRREAEFTESQVNDRYDFTLLGRIGRKPLFVDFFYKFIEQYLQKQYPTWTVLDKRRSPLWDLQAVYRNGDSGRANDYMQWIADSERLDLKVMEAKAKQDQYHLFEEMYADLSTIAHNLIFLFKKKPKMQTTLQEKITHIDLLQKAFCDEQASASQCLGCYQNYAEQAIGVAPTEARVMNHWMEVPCYRLHLPVWWKCSEKHYKHFCNANNWNEKEGLGGWGNVYQAALMYLAPDQPGEGRPIRYHSANRHFVLKTITDPELKAVNRHFTDTDFLFNVKDFAEKKESADYEKHPKKILIRDFSVECPEKAIVSNEVKQFQADCANLINETLKANWEGYHFLWKKLREKADFSNKKFTLPNWKANIHGESNQFTKLSIPSFIRPRGEWPDNWGKEEEAIVEGSEHWEVMSAQQIYSYYRHCVILEQEYPMPIHAQRTMSKETYDRTRYGLLTLITTLKGPFIRCKHCLLAIASTEAEVYPFCSTRCAYLDAYFAREEKKRKKAEKAAKEAAEAANGNASEEDHPGAAAAVR